MNPMNWISATGLSPSAAMPTASPLISSSASGVSSTRSGPKRFCRPTVARNTPPFMPTSSPNTTPSGSSCSARASARLTASTRVISGIRPAPRKLAALGGVDLGQLGIEMLEHRLRGARGRGQVARNGGIDALLAVARELFLLRLAPGLLGDEIGPEAGDGLLLPVRLHLFRRAIARGVVSRRMIAKPVGDGLDEARPLTVAGRGYGLLGGLPHGEDIVAVDLLAGEAGGDGLLRQGRARRLESERHRDRPLVVVDHEHDGQLLDAGEIHGLVDIALGGGAVAQQADGDARLSAQLDGVGDAGGVRRLRAHRDAEGKVVGGTR